MFVQTLTKRIVQKGVQTEVHILRGNTVVPSLPASALPLHSGPRGTAPCSRSLPDSFLYLCHNNAHIHEYMFEARQTIRAVWIIPHYSDHSVEFPTMSNSIPVLTDTWCSRTAIHCPLTVKMAQLNCPPAGCELTVDLPLVVIDLHGSKHTRPPTHGPHCDQRRVLPDSWPGRGVQSVIASKTSRFDLISAILLIDCNSHRLHSSRRWTPTTRGRCVVWEKQSVNGTDGVVQAFFSTLRFCVLPFLQPAAFGEILPTPQQTCLNHVVTVVCCRKRVLSALVKLMWKCREMPEKFIQSRGGSCLWSLPVGWSQKREYEWSFVYILGMAWKEVSH